MDTHSLIPLTPSQLWIGTHTTLLKEVKQWLAKQLCANNGCSVCVTCKQIYDYQHHAIQWFYPESRYTIDQLDPIKHALSFSLNPQEKQFFIIQKADSLTPACANSLLKSLEEPPRGFYFILTAERLHALLPTIISRCTIKHFHQRDLVPHPITTYFTTERHHDPFKFLAELESAALTEHDSFELLDEILAYWLERFQKQPFDKQATQIIAFLKKQMEFTPMPGSSKLFWKNMYLSYIGLRPQKASS